MTGEVVYVTREELRAAEEGQPLEDFPDWQHGVIRITGEILETDHALPLLNRFEINEYHIMEPSASRAMMTICEMICVMPYVVEERFDVSKTAFKRMGLRRRGTGIVLQPSGRLPLRVVMGDEIP
jgi:hypothetical protein